ncbi:uncharacterized protein Hap1MRO34_017035 [Clarias gariepinus]
MGLMPSVGREEASAAAWGAIVDQLLLKFDGVKQLCYKKYLWYRRPGEGVLRKLTQSLHLLDFASRCRGAVRAEVQQTSLMASSSSPVGLHTVAADRNVPPGPRFKAY